MKTMTIYVDWAEQKIYSEYEAKEALTEGALFNDWLNEQYFASDIYHMSDKEKQLLQLNALGECFERYDFQI